MYVQSKNGYDLNDRSAWWHNCEDQRRQNMLFADGHATFLKFAKESAGWVYDRPPDPGYLWW